MLPCALCYEWNNYRLDYWTYDTTNRPSREIDLLSVVMPKTDIRLGKPWTIQYFSRYNTPVVWWPDGISWDVADIIVAPLDGGGESWNYSSIRDNLASRPLNYLRISRFNRSSVQSSCFMSHCISSGNPGTYRVPSRLTVDFGTRSVCDAHGYIHQ
eukprot:TRINITY_DN10618_c0_g1_i1.p3 TRINITY_DN10618_c0_g1~~TRINITY_DN10618_c0_g1_i1.p3  ORF type:complete len:156 (+),score=6.58 TRINITY_DN10618_c0_g1_i1:358-825(+)